MTRNPLLLRGSLAALRHKLTSSVEREDELGSWWRHFLTLARQDGYFTAYPILAALVTESEEDRRRARDAFLRLVALAPQGLSSIESQFHTHVTAAQLGRWAIYYDWLADSGLFSADEDAAIRAVLLDYAFVFPYQGLKGRIRSFDNQILANAFGSAAIGYVFGVRRGQSATARRVFACGLEWLQELFKLLPADGYSGEGSTYQEHVVLPLVLLSALLVEESTGQNVLEHGIAPGPPALEVVRFTHDLIGPAGLLPAWDDHGFQLATVKAPLAYLARATGDTRPLDTSRATRMWSRTALPAWEADDRLWTLAWWPDEAPRKALAPHFSPWMVRGNAGALQHAPHRVRLFQYWDHCGGLGQAGRLQTDPNAITLEAFGSPLLVDGNGDLPVDMVAYAETATEYVGKRLLETIREYHGWDMPAAGGVRHALSGNIARSNALVIDEEDWFVPRRPCSGMGLDLHDTPWLQALTSEANDFYGDRYDTQSVTRTSLLLPGGVVFVCDEVQGRHPLKLKWQAYLRETARLEGETAVIETPEQVRCNIVPLQPGGCTLTPVESYPRYAVGRSVRLEFRPDSFPSSRQRLDFALVPQPLYELGMDITRGWHFNFGAERGGTVSLDRAYLEDRGTHPEQNRKFERQIQVAARAGKIFLCIGGGSAQLILRVNGQRARPTVAPQKGIWPKSQNFLPHWFEVTSLLHPGDNALELEAPFFHGESVVGPAQLLWQRAAQPVSARRTGAETFALCVGNAKSEVVVAREGSGPWLHGTTDARHALLAPDGTLSLLSVAHLELAGQARLTCQPAADVVLKPHETWLLQAHSGTRLMVTRPQSELRVEYGSCLEVTYHGQEPHTLHLDWRPGNPIFINGAPATISSNVDSKYATLHLDPTASVEPTPVDLSVESLYEVAAAEGAGASVRQAVLTALANEDWRLQVAAAELAGRLEVTEAVPLLLELFQAAGDEWPYPPLEKRWAWSKMLNQAEPQGHDPDLPEIAIKRWRVRRAAVTALGLLGDSRAVPPLEEALLSCHDFFPVTSQLAVALGRLGSPTSLAVLERHLNHAEINTCVHSRLAHQVLSGALNRREFESKVGLL